MRSSGTEAGLLWRKKVHESATFKAREDADVRWASGVFKKENGDMSRILNGFGKVCCRCPP